MKPSSVDILLIAEPTSEEAALLGRMSHHWHILIDPIEQSLADALVEQGWLQRRRQSRRGFGSLYRLPLSELPPDHAVSRLT